MTTQRTAPRIEVHIDELVLHGFAAPDGQRIGDAVRRELTRLLAEQGLSPALIERRDHGRIDAGAITAGQGTGGAAIGAQVARAVHRGLSR